MRRRSSRRSRIPPDIHSTNQNKHRKRKCQAELDDDDEIDNRQTALNPVKTSKGRKKKPYTSPPIEKEDKKLMDNGNDTKASPAVGDTLVDNDQEGAVETGTVGSGERSGESEMEEGEVTSSEEEEVEEEIEEDLSLGISGA